MMLILTGTRAEAQVTVLSCTGTGDAGIDVILPSSLVALTWSQTVAFSDVMVTTGLYAPDGNETGWASLDSGAGNVAYTDFAYPNSYGNVVLFTGLTLPVGTYSLTIGALSGEDGWGVPAGNPLYGADGVTYLNTVSTFGLSYPVDFSIVSTPEPSAVSVFGLGILAITGQWLRTRALRACQP
jgi:hypothetical protein